MKRKAPSYTDAVAFRTRSNTRTDTISANKRQKTNHYKDWVAATHTRNYMIKDPLVDWLKLGNRRGTRTTPSYNKATGFTKFIMNKGIEFESQLIKYINTTKIPVVTVWDGNSQPITPETCKKTKDLMMAGTPLIHSAPVKTKDNTGGVIDLLVRSDYLDQLVEECPITQIESTIPAPNLGGEYHYLVIDVKFSTLPLRSNGKTLLNSGSIPAYKAQTWMYTSAIAEIQGYTPKYAFIMGRRWKYTHKDIKYHNYTCLNKLGTIDFHGVDKHYIQETEKAIQWVRDVKQHGKDWTTYPPSRPELYPNMCVDSGTWNVEKKKIADRIKEITTIWYCGIKHRVAGINNGFDNWKDPGCTSENIGMKKGKRAQTIDQILSINRQNKDKLRPQNINSDMFNWSEKGNELFVDFETLSDIFSDFDNLPRQDPTDMIFMIGVGWEQDGEWVYKNFICNEATQKEEYRIMDEFATFVNERKNPKLFYWHAEDSFWNRAENKHFDIACDEYDTEKKDHISDVWKVTEWADLAKLFRTEPIVIKDCFKFGLKEIAAAMRKHKLITTKIESSCNSGMAAMINAWNCYKDENEPATCSTMKDIAKYNEFDVKVLWEIISYIRKNHPPEEELDE